MEQQGTIATINQSLAQLEQNLADLERQKSAVSLALESLKQARSHLAVLSTNGTLPPQATPTTGGRNTGRSRLRPTTELIVKVLQQAGRPMSCADIARELIESGCPNNMKKIRDATHSFLRHHANQFQKVKENNETVWVLAAAATQTQDHARESAQTNADLFAPSSTNGIVNQSNDGQGISLAGKDIAEAARIILVERGNAPTHYREIAAEAARRGYKSIRSGMAKPESFAVMMTRKPTQFIKLGEGKFKLKDF
jgi:hypothetical protein